MENTIKGDASLFDIIANLQDQNEELKAELEINQYHFDNLSKAFYKDTIDFEKKIMKLKAELEKYKKGFEKTVTTHVQNWNCDSCMFHDDCTHENDKECEELFVRHFLEDSK